MTLIFCEDLRSGARTLKLKVNDTSTKNSQNTLRIITTLLSAPARFFTVLIAHLPYWKLFPGVDSCGKWVEMVYGQFLHRLRLFVTSLAFVSRLINGCTLFHTFV